MRQEADIILEVHYNYDLFNITLCLYHFYSSVTMKLARLNLANLDPSMSFGCLQEHIDGVDYFLSIHSHHG